MTATTQTRQQHPLGPGRSELTPEEFLRQLDPDALEQARRDLKAARALIADERHWCQRVSRQKLADGGTAFCSVGALAEIADPDMNRYAPAVVLLRGALLRSGMGLSITQFNDHRETTHRDVLAIFDRAAELKLW